VACAVEGWKEGWKKGVEVEFIVATYHGTIIRHVVCVWSFPPCINEPRKTELNQL